MSLTRNNICYDFDISPYFIELEYQNNKAKFVFSSELYKTKFTEKYLQNRQTINTSLSNRFGFSIVNDELADLKLYTQIEKRGFLIFQNGKKFECLKNITLDGQQMITKR